MWTIEKNSAKFLMGIQNPTQMTDWLDKNENICGLSFVGRSNVGKSSLINSIFGNKTARVSKMPGRTREINIFSFTLRHSETKEVKEFHFLDLPGYGFAEVSKEMSGNWHELMYLFFDRCLPNVAIINLQDARHPNQNTDEIFFNYLNKKKFHTILVLNKLDKLKSQKEKNELKDKMPHILKKYKFVKQIFSVSAEKLTGIKELELSLINYLLKQI